MIPSTISMISELWKGMTIHLREKSMLLRMEQAFVFCWKFVG